MAPAYGAVLARATRSTPSSSPNPSSVSRPRCCAGRVGTRASGRRCLSWWSPARSSTSNAPGPSRPDRAYADRGPRVDARRPLSKKQIATIAAWRARREALATATARREAIRLARRIGTCDEELEDNRRELTALVEASQAAQLLTEPGIGAVNAAVVLTAWSHRGRIHSEAAFAAITGTCPIPASSGNTTRHRLNRGGDRRLNRALSSIALTRMSHDPATRDYVTRRRAEGRTTNELRRSLKRSIARQLDRRLTNPPTQASTA